MGTTTKQSAWLGVGGSLLMATLAACGTNEETNASRSRLGPVNAVSLKVDLPTGLGLHQAAIGTTNSLEISNRSQVVASSGFAPIANVGNAGSRLGVEAQSGDSWSASTLILANRSRVNGDVHAPNGLERQMGSVVTGSIDQTTPITTHSYTWNADFQQGTSPIMLEPRKTRSLEPGAYTDVSVKPRATLSLRTGTYYLQSLQVEPSATLALDTQQGPILVYVSQSMHHRGSNRYTGDDNAALFAYLGTGSVALGGPFTGSIVAPTAELALGPGKDPGQPNLRGFKGSFFGKRVWAHPDLTITYSAFKHWDFLLPPQPFVVCVSKVGVRRYSALFGYDNPLDRTASIPIGAANSLSGELAGSGVTPPVSFAAGRVEQALWVPFSTEVSWSIHGKSATATTASAECPATAFPSKPTPLALSGVDAEGPSRDIAPSTPKAPDFSLPQEVSEEEIFAAMGALPTRAPTAALSINQGKGIVALQQSITAATGNFVVKLTSIHVPDGDPGSHQEPYISSYTIDGHGQEGGSLGECSEDSTCSLNKVNTQAVPLTQPFVDVAIDIKEDDSSSANDNELQVRLKVNNVTGLVVSGTAHSTEPDTTTAIGAGATCGDAEGWTLCWEIQSAGVPIVEGDVNVCTFWNAYFVDEGKGESRMGLPIPQGSDPVPPVYRAYPASFTRAVMHVRSAFVPTVDEPFVFDGNLDEFGCTKVPAQYLVHRSNVATIEEGDLSVAMLMGTAMSAPGEVTYIITDRLMPSATHPNQFEIEKVAMGTTNADLGGEIREDEWPKQGQWHVPPSTVQVFHRGHTPMTNTAAAITSVLTSFDPGIPAGTYNVRVNTGLRLPDGVNVDSTGGSDLLSVGPSHTISECTSQDPMTGECLVWNYSKPPCTASSECEGAMECLFPLPDHCFDSSATGELPPECVNSESCNGQTGCYCRLPHQARWKYVLAHEAGHQIQHRAAGDFSTGDYGFVCPTGTVPGSPQCPGNLSQYTVGGVVDFPWVGDTCGCGHVRAANQEHCLQSVERSGPAQSEGFAQFYASRSWNQPEGDCTFTYYKEFLDTTCRNPSAQPGDCKPFVTNDGQELISTLPPAAVSCRQPVRWRNKQQCSIVSGSSGKAGDYGTEYDWMGFLYSINRPATPAIPRVPTNDIWLIYRHACDRATAPGTPVPADPALCTRHPFVWDATNTSVTPATNEPKVAGFLQGAVIRYANDALMQSRIVEESSAYGVAADTTSLP